MPEVFINYRNGDEENTAAMIEKELSRRFGSEVIFRASKSIKPGEDYTHSLLSNVRRSSLLLVVIGPRWSSALDGTGQRALENENDWTRKEILEAFTHGLLVVPVLVGRKMLPLKRSELPEALAGLADRQYRRFDYGSADDDLARLGNTVAELVPRLTDLDRDKAVDPASRTSGVHNSVSDQRGMTIQSHDYTNRQSGGIGNVSGDVGTFINDSHGPVNTGNGHQYNGPRFSGDGVNYITGDNKDGIRQRFVPRREREDDER
ncbi:toll/interleukin-1 receptor domain-containing protein [Streptomyces chrestomyceticus]|uniref:toll/interleukin-1 receptor domain-containing protein n=1 Tax=Streptomyces chrestomyceticus TaxID=68185 RepID=UPI0036A04425